MMDRFEFNYFVYSETAQKATKHFVRNLECILEQYQNLWTDYLKLLKEYDESRAKISKMESQLQEVTAIKDVSLAKQITIKNDQMAPVNTQKEDLFINEKQESSIEEQTETSISDIHEATIPEIYSMDFNTDDLERNYLQQCKSPRYKSEQFSVAESPVLCKRSTKSVKNNSALKSDNQKINSSNSTKDCRQIPDNAALQGTQVNSERTPLKALENNSFEALFVDKNQSSSMNSKVYKKLGISTLYNVSTDISLDGTKRLRQSRLVLQPIKKKTDVSFCTDDTENTYYKSQGTKEDNTYATTNSYVPKNAPCPDRSKEVHSKVSTDQEEENKMSHEEDVITVSPIQIKFSSKIRNKLKHKRKGNNSELTENCALKFNSSNSTSSDADTSINTQPCAPDAKPIELELLHSSQLPAKVKLEVRSDLMKPVTAIHNSDIDEVICIEKPTLSKSHNVLNEKLLSAIKEEQFTKPRVESSGSNSTLEQQKGKCNYSRTTKRKRSEGNLTHGLYSDETFYAPAELSVEQYLTNENDVKSPNSRTVVTTSKPKCRSPPSRRNLASSFDMIPVKKKSSPKHAYKSKPVRNKNERTKLPGWDCWECKKYYEGIGLSEKEIQLRKNQCSRHRTKYNERQNTPEGFWNPVFSDTLHSTYNE